MDQQSKWKPRVMAKFLYNKLYNLDVVINMGHEDPLTSEWRIKAVACEMIDDNIREQVDWYEIEYWLQVKKEVRFFNMMN